MFQLSVSMLRFKISKIHRFWWTAYAYSTSHSVYWGFIMVTLGGVDCQNKKNKQLDSKDKTTWFYVHYSPLHHSYQCIHFQSITANRRINGAIYNPQLVYVFCINIISWLFFRLWIKSIYTSTYKCSQHSSKTLAYPWNTKSTVKPDL